VSLIRHAGGCRCETRIFRYHVRDASWLRGGQLSLKQTVTGETESAAKMLRCRSILDTNQELTGSTQISIGGKFSVFSK
jgi:hypothetical protein